MNKVFFVNIKNILHTDYFKYYLNLLDDENQINIQKFYKKEDSNRFLFSKLLPLYIIKKLKPKIKKDDIVIKTNDYGKPYFENIDDIKFNISHSGDWIVCAISDKEVGVDIQEVDEINALEICSNFFSEIEITQLKECNDIKKIDFFYMLWNLKESYIKFKGMGLNISLDSFSFMLNDYNKNLEIYNIIDLYIEEEINQYINFFQKKIDNDYFFALCSFYKNYEIEYVNYKYLEII